MQDSWHGDDIPPVDPSFVPPTEPGTLRRYQHVTMADIPTSDEKTMAMLCHLLGLFTWFIAPLIIWLMKKDESRFIDFHGRESLNWAFSIFLYEMIAVVLTVVSMVVPFLSCVCIPVILALSITDLILKIVMAVAASNGQWKRYPMSIPFFGLPTH